MTKASAREEEAFLRHYDPRAFEPAAVTVDLVILTIRDGALCVLLVERAGFPHKGWTALPGGFVRKDETLLAAAERELLEETGIETPGHLEQLAAYWQPGRDPRPMIVTTVAYLALVPDLPEPQSGTDAARAWLTPVDEAVREELAFDHAQILADGVERARAKLEHASVATAFLREPFRLSELRAVYEAVWGQPLDPANFRRKVLGTEDFVRAAGRRVIPSESGGRPAQLYKRGRAKELRPPLTRAR